MVKIIVISLFLSWVNSTVQSLTLAVNSDLKIPSYSLCPAADYQLGKQKENVYFKSDTLITKSNIAHVNPIQGLQVKISVKIYTTVHWVFIGKDGKTWNNYEQFSSVQALLNSVFWREKTKVDSSG